MGEREDEGIALKQGT